MNLDDLELYEVTREESAPDAVVEELTAKDFATAQRYMSRVKYHRTKAAELAKVYDYEMARLQKRKDEALRPYLSREQYYTSALEQFAIAEVGNRKTDKTVKLPDGNLAVRDQQPEWNYGDGDVLANFLKAEGLDKFLRTKYEPIKTDIKEAGKVRDGRVFFANTDGELVVATPITVTERPPKVTITIA